MDKNSRKSNCYIIVNPYINNASICVKCNVLAALDFVPVDKVNETFETRQADISQELQELCDAFEDT